MMKRLLASLAGVVACAGISSAQFVQPLELPPAAEEVTAQVPEEKKGPAPEKVPAPKAEPVLTEAPMVVSDDGVAAGARLWASTEYLAWWIKDMPVPMPLVTAGSFPLIGEPDTTVLFGNNDIDFGTFSGSRLTVGGWLGANRLVGVEFSGFVLAERSHEQTFSSNTANIVAESFFDTGFNGESFFNYNVAGINGGVTVTAASQMWGAEALGVLNLRRGNAALDLLGGFRYLGLEESLSLNTFSDVIGFSVPQDRFETRNQYYGATIGLRAGIRGNRFSADVTCKIGIGLTDQATNITGVTNVVGVPGLQFPNGLYAQASNLGERSGNEFTIVPELQLKLGYRVTRRLHMTLGYDFLYWSEVVRAAEQIDRGLNILPEFGLPSLTPDRPAPVRKQGFIWAQGVNAGLEFRY